MPFQPGKSGNPAGRPKGYRAFRMALKERLIESGLNLQAIESIIKDKSHRDRAFMIKWATEYALGKPAERHQHTGPNGGPIEIKTMTDDELQSKLAQLFATTRGGDDSPGAGASNGNGTAH